MFDFLRNKAMSFVTDDLDNCLAYIKNLGVETGPAVDQILNTIHHFVEKIAAGEASEQGVQKHFMTMKTNVATQKNLSNYRDVDYCKAYILNAFFTAVNSNRLENSKSIGVKILNYCAANVSPQHEIAGKQLRDTYSQIFK